MKYNKTLQKICRLPKVTAPLVEGIFQKHENISVGVMPKNIGRPGFEIVTDEGLCFVTERPIEYYNKKWGRVTILQERMLNLQIPVPLYIGEGTIVKDIHAILKLPDPKKSADTWLHENFSIETAIAYFHKYFSTSDSLGVYKTIIFEAIEAYYMGMDHIAIMALIPVFEGGLRNIQNTVLGKKIDNVRSREFEKGLSELTRMTGQKQLVHYAWYPGKFFHCNVEVDFLTHICPQSDVINAFRLFFKNVLYKPSYGSGDDFNRHVIVHMLKSTFANPANFIRIFLALTHITFIESLYNQKVPFFWRGFDDNDKKVGAYIRASSQAFGDPRRKLLNHLGISQYDLVC